MSLHDKLLVPRLLSDKYNLRILSATSARPMSAQELSMRFDIPIATCYRKIRELELANLIKTDSKARRRYMGKHYTLYRSNVTSARISFKDGSLKINLDLARDEDQATVVDVKGPVQVENLVCP